MEGRWEAVTVHLHAAVCRPVDEGQAVSGGHRAAARRGGAVDPACCGVGRRSRAQRATRSRLRADRRDQIAVTTAKPGAEHGIGLSERHAAGRCLPPVDRVIAAVGEEAKMDDEDGRPDDRRGIGRTFPVEQRLHMVRRMHDQNVELAPDLGLSASVVIALSMATARAARGGASIRAINAWVAARRVGSVGICGAGAPSQSNPNISNAPECRTRSCRSRGHGWRARGGSIRTARCGIPRPLHRPRIAPVTLTDVPRPFSRRAVCRTALFHLRDRAARWRDRTAADGHWH